MLTIKEMSVVLQNTNCMNKHLQKRKFCQAVTTILTRIDSKQNRLPTESEFSIYNDALTLVVYASNLHSEWCRSKKGKIKQHLYKRKIPE